MSWFGICFHLLIVFELTKVLFGFMIGCFMMVVISLSSYIIVFTSYGLLCNLFFTASYYSSRNCIHIHYNIG